ncbi:unnamed protein product [Clavelina lepadiformis]|uniref:Ferritin n=1 Tax=Clavelina lepadiformis TaxID=159417 RepID=A0ABP0FT50_CLALP
MKVLINCCFLAVCFAPLVMASSNCHSDKLKCYEANVNELINDQIAVELKGQYTYLHLSYLFLQDFLYYPKVSKYFREKADEELGHAEKFMTYQNQRGGTFKIEGITRKTNGKCSKVGSLKQGFACAKELEIEVTKALTKLLADVSNVTPVSNCSGVDITIGNKDLLMGQSILFTANGSTKPLKLHPCSADLQFDKVEYVELAEMIAHDFLGHQLEDTKELANMEATLSKFNPENENLGSFLADKHFDL